MNICYIVLTCEKYLTTRLVWQLETCFKEVDKKDIYYLGPYMDVTKQMYSWGAPDNYASLPYKIYDFFRNIRLEYDWYMLIDDDTYVYHKRFVEHLLQYNPNDLIAEGKLLNHIQNTEWGVYHSGGAGTVLSRAVYNHLCEYLRFSLDSCVPHWCADISLGYWLKKIPHILMKNNDLFCPDNYNPSIHSLDKMLTFHHLKEWSDYHKIDSS